MIIYERILQYNSILIQMYHDNLISLQHDLKALFLVDLQLNSKFMFVDF